MLRMIRPWMKVTLASAPFVLAAACGDDSPAGNGEADAGAATLPDGSAVANGDGATTSEGGASDGTVAEPNPVRLLTGMNGIEQLQWLNGALYFRAFDDAAGREPWRSDLTPQGTFRLADVCAGTCSSETTMLKTTPSGGRYFVDEAASSIFHTDSTVAGTVRLGTGGQPFFAVGEKVVFKGSGTSVSITDGTVAGTTALKALSPYFFNDENSSLSVGSWGLFSILYDSGGSYYRRKVFATDGTEAGTVEVTGGQYVELAAAAGGVGFVVSKSVDPINFTSSQVVIATNGTVAGTKSLGNFADTSSFGAVGSRVLFNGKALQSGATSGLWSADATAATKLVNQGPGNPPLDVGGIGFYTYASEVWTSDGTLANTKVAHDGNPKALGSLVMLGDELYGVARENLGFTLTLSKFSGTPRVVTEAAVIPNDCPDCVPDSGVTYDLYQTYEVTAGRMVVTRRYTERIAGGFDSPKMTTFWSSDGTAAGTKKLNAQSAQYAFPVPGGVVWGTASELWFEKL